MNKIRRSLFLKLLLVFCFAGILVLLGLFIFEFYLSRSEQLKAHRGQNMVEYGHLLAKSLEPNLSPEVVLALSQKLHMKIRVEKDGQTFLSSPDVPTFKDIQSDAKLFYHEADERYGIYRQNMAINVKSADNSHFLFLMERDEKSLNEHPEWLLEAIVFLFALLFLIYILIRIILRPLISLEKGVVEVSTGNLNVKIPQESQDELGKLVYSFNQMTAQIRDMIRARDQLLLDVSHEFRSPLTRIKVAIELDDKDSLESIKHSVKELETMVSEILETARLDDPKGQLKLETVNIAHILSDLIQRYEHTAPGVVLNYSNNNYLCKIDPLRMRLVFQNLLENAIKYSSHQSRPIEISISRKDDKIIQIEFRDFGIGISEEEQLLIFEPFYRVDRSRVRTSGGYGLGLSLCKKIVTAHEGRIHVQSGNDVGTVFIIELSSNI